MAKQINFISYKRTSFEEWAYKNIPYWKILPLNKRQRVLLRIKFRDHWRHKIINDLYKTLKNCKFKEYVPLKINIDEYSWEIIEKN